MIHDGRIRSEDEQYRQLFIEMPTDELISFLRGNKIMADNRLKLFPAPAVMRVKELFPQKFSGRVATMLDRYQGLLDYHQSDLQLKEQERHAVVECLQGNVVDAVFIDCLDQELADSGYTGLAKKIADASYADRVLLVESLGNVLARE